MAVALTGKGGFGLEDFAGFPGFGDARGATSVCFRSGTMFFAAIQVKESYWIAEAGVPGYGAAAAILGVAWMTASYYNACGFGC
jgi:hypothetical protein